MDLQYPESAFSGLGSADFSADQIGALRKTGAHKRWRRGDVLLCEGGAPDCVIMIEEGQIKATVHASNGYTSLLAVRGPGELVGEMACLDGRPRSATVTASTAGLGTVISADRFLALLQGNAGLAMAVLRSVGARLRHSDTHRAGNGAHTARTRIASVLADLAHRYGVPALDAGPRARRVQVTQQDLAGASGTSRESVVRALKELERAGLVSRNRGVLLVQNPTRLNGWPSG
ncbi:cyclic nucleotide-binding domain-containing protein [Streptomonospora salina]